MTEILDIPEAAAAVELVLLDLHRKAQAVGGKNQYAYLQQIAGAQKALAVFVGDDEAMTISNDCHTVAVAEKAAA